MNIAFLKQKGFLTTGEVARRLGVQIGTVWVWINKGVQPRVAVKLPSVRVGNRNLVDPNGLTRFLDLTGRQPLLPFPPEEGEVAA